MAQFDWSGGHGRYSNPAHWDQQGVPGQGDTAVIASGDAVIRWEDVQATVVLGGFDPDVQPVLELRHASLNLLTMPDNLLRPIDPSLPIAPEYATLDVRGQSSIGAIQLGDFEDISAGVGAPGGFGPLNSPETLTVDLGPHAGLTAGFDVKFGSTLTVSGSEASSFSATDSTIEGGQVVINAPVIGQGTIFLTTGPVNDVFGRIGTLEVGSSVGADTTIDIRMGNLVVDQPMAFLGQTDLRPDENPDPSQKASLGSQTVTLKDLIATSYSFDDASHVMTLFNGDNAVDQVRFTPDVMSSFFDVTNLTLGGVYQTGGDVLVRGVFSHAPIGAAVIPAQS